MLEAPRQKCGPTSERSFRALHNQQQFILIITDLDAFLHALWSYSNKDSFRLMILVICGKIKSKLCLNFKVMVKTKVNTIIIRI